jgi:hypothetical protein
MNALSRALQTLLHSRNKDATLNDFKFEILICFNHSSPNTELPYTKHPKLPNYLN